MGADTVLVSTLGIGVVFGQAQNVLAMYDHVNQQMLDVTVPALSTTPAPLPATTLTRPVLTFTGRLLRTPDAINVPPTIRVYMNYRLSDQRGIVYPVPTMQNNSPANTTGNTAGNEGLQDMVLDEARGKVYITNSGYNRIEVFDTQKQHFVDPIPVRTVTAPDGDGERRQDALRGQYGQRIDSDAGSGPGAGGG